MIINCGLKRVISTVRDEEENYKTFLVDDWVKDWQKSDIIEDKYKYGQEVKR